jgi:hypothetical protein
MNSHMNLNKIAIVLATLALGVSVQSHARADEVTGHASYINNAGQVVHCVSTASGRAYCGKPHMRYVIKTPGAVCVEGSTWGTDERGVWVSGGCNADFDTSAEVVANEKVTTTVVATGATGDGDEHEGAPVRLVHCIATPSGRTYCGTRHTRYVYSGSPNPVCVEGKTWGFDDHGVWVTGGCKGDFTYNDD